MQTREAHQLAADILVELAALDEQPLAPLWPDSLWPDAMRNEARHAQVGCEVPEWALDLAQSRLDFERHAAA